MSQASTKQNEKQPSIRLTNEMRDRIIEAAVKARFDAEKKARAKAEDALGRKLYKIAFTEAERRAVEKLPSRWWREDKCLRFNVGGMTLQFNLDGQGVKVPTINCNTLAAITDRDLIEEARSHADSTASGRKAREAAKGVLRGLVYSVTTIGALRSVWPEGAAFYRDIQAPPSTQIAPIVADINKLFGLPSFVGAAS